jgi:1-acyl-sn-glycerol-3-phosphate acyltransferase
VLAVPTLLVITPLRNPARGWRLARVVAIFFLRLCRLPLLVQGIERIPASGPFVMAVNHASYLDGLILLAALPERGYSFAAKRELREAFVPRLFLQAIGTDFVERADIRQGVEDTSRLAESVRAGRVPVFSGSTFTAGPPAVRMGAFIIAVQTGVPLVLVRTIRGARSVLREGIGSRAARYIVVAIAQPSCRRAALERRWRCAMRHAPKSCRRYGGGPGAVAAAGLTWRCGKRSGNCGCCSA